LRAGSVSGWLPSRGTGHTAAVAPVVIAMSTPARTGTDDGREDSLRRLATDIWDALGASQADSEALKLAEWRTEVGESGETELRPRLRRLVMEAE
jgi:hypothetical protein